MTKVLQFNVAPKQTTKIYKQKEIVVRFDPNTSEWVWQVEHVQPVYLTGREETQKKAEKEAMKMVDIIVDI